MNNRVFYACESVGISPFQATPAYTAVRGLQTVGAGLKFQLEALFEIGQLASYEFIENLPDAELTLEKVLDGYPLVYHLATQGAAASTLAGRSNQRCHVAMSIFDDTSSNASGVPISQQLNSGMYVSQVGYDVMVEGDAKESCTLVGNHQSWLTGSFTFSGMSGAHGVTSMSPAAPSGVNRRQDMIMSGCLWPRDIRGINSSRLNVDTGSGFNAPIQSVKVSANLGREMLLELGRRGPYFRYVNFPVEVSTAIETNARDGSLKSASEDGIYAGNMNVQDETIFIAMNEGLQLNMGTKNKLNSVNYGGANAGGRGGNATITYQYTNQNDLDVKHTADPTAGLRP